MSNILIILVVLCTLTQAQQYGHTWVNNAAPSGACPGPSELTINISNGNVYSCNSGTWASSPSYYHINVAPSIGYAHYTGTAWQFDTPAGGGLPSGLIVISLTACPSGFTESTALNGKMLRGTIAANGDVGTTGGNTTITPTGTVQQATFTGTPFTTVINHTHTVNVTDPGHTHTINATTYVEQGQGSTTASTTGTHIMTSASTGGSLRSVESTVSKAPTENLQVTGISATTSNPVGGVASITPAGTINSQSFTGDAIDPSPSYTKVIFCQAN